MMSLWTRASVALVIACVAASVAACSSSSSGKNNSSGDGGTGSSGGGLSGIFKKGDGGGGSSGGGGILPPAGSDGGGGGSGSGGSCSGQTSTDPCESCLYASCCNEVLQCANSQDCQTLISCAQECNGDQTCISNCAQNNQAGSQAISPLIQCAQTKCTACN